MLRIKNPTRQNGGKPRSGSTQPAEMAGNPRSGGRPAFFINESGLYSNNNMFKIENETDLQY